MLKRASMIVACAAMLIPAFRATADEWDKKTVMTFSQPVELPGVVLPAGTYVFKLANLQGSRNVIQVFNAEENQIIATILAIPHQHPQAHDQTYVGFEERRADTPQAIHEWFYPGNDRGLEFVYPKPRAEELVRETHQPVLAAEVSPSETPAQLEQKSVVAITPDDKELKIAETFDETLAAPARAITPPAAAAEYRRELPGTASPIALLLLLGSVSFVLAAAVRAIARNK